VTFNDGDAPDGSPTTIENATLGPNTSGEHNGTFSGGDTDYFNYEIQKDKP
jgi:hypothetical protein